MITLERFKSNDTTEGRIIAAAVPIFDEAEDGLDDLYEGAFTCYQLGDVLYALDRDPMVGVITPEVYRSSFFAIHALFTRPGTFEFYLEVFRAIWGPDVEIQFSVPAAGKLLINVAELTTEDFMWLSREIVGDSYVYEQMLDREGNNIMLQDLAGTKNQSEVTALIREVSPAGIWVVADLTF